MKKIILILLAIVALAGGVLFFINSKDTYDADKYSASLSDGLNIGSTLSYTMPDQFGKSHKLDDSIDRLILVFTKATGHTVKAYLKDQSADYLAKHNAAFIADISPMPVVIRNTFALPDLKSQHYSVIIIHDGKIAEDFKKGIKSDDIIIATLKDQKVTKITYAKNSEELEKALAK